MNVTSMNLVKDECILLYNTKGNAMEQIVTTVHLKTTWFMNFFIFNWTSFLSIINLDNNAIR